jgi:hypothetical protein
MYIGRLACVGAFRPKGLASRPKRPYGCLKYDRIITALFSGGQNHHKS